MTALGRYWNELSFYYHHESAFFPLLPLTSCLLISLLLTCHASSLCSGPKKVCTKSTQHYDFLEYYYSPVLLCLASLFTISIFFSFLQWWKCVFILQIDLPVFLLFFTFLYLPFILCLLPLFPFILTYLFIFAHLLSPSLAAWAGRTVWGRLPSNVGEGGWQPHLTVHLHLSSAALPAGCHLVQRW